MAFTLFALSGQTVTENLLASLVSALGQGVVSGFAVQGTNGLQLTIGSGVAIVGGYRVMSDSAVTVTLPASATSVVALQVTLNQSNQASGAQIVVISGQWPPATLALYQVVTSSTAITKVVPLMPPAPGQTGLAVAHEMVPDALLRAAARRLVITSYSTSVSSPTFSYTAPASSTPRWLAGGLVIAYLPPGVGTSSSRLSLTTTLDGGTMSFFDAQINFSTTNVPAFFPFPSNLAYTPFSTLTVNGSYSFQLTWILYLAWVTTA